MFGHILINEGPERDTAIRLFIAKLDANKINYDDLRGRPPWRTSPAGITSEIA